MTTQRHLMRAILLILVFAGSSGLGHSQPVEIAVEALLAGVRCEPAVRRQLSAWDAQLAKAVFEPPLSTGGRRARAPTGALGLWVRIVEESPRQVVLERISSTRIERLSFDDECGIGESAVAVTVPPPGAMSDADLITLVAREDRGVILLWSPHMPLSVDQHAVLARVAGNLGLTVVSLLDPAADPDYATRVARERTLPADSTRPLGGVELALRGMATHTPSLQVFAGGQLIGPVLYGYRSDDALRTVLEAVLAPR